MDEALSPQFWSERYKSCATGWDLGQISPPLEAYFNQLENKDLKILIPGCGSGYEAEYLHSLGFRQVHLLDFAAEPLEAFAKRVHDFPAAHLHQEDFFTHEGQYDLIIEQTLFCAIDPKLRPDYAKNVKRLLKPSGKLVGLLFNRDFEGGPPFGGTKEEYMTYFRPYFSLISMEECYNSAAPRQGTELFVVVSGVV